MDYEKKYKELVGKIEKAYLYTQTLSTKAVLEDILPELSEGEDEKIRKALIRFHKSTIDIDGIKGEKILAWLEKQGEPKWTEEDECYMGECISAVATKDGWSFEEKRKTKQWLQSLKRRIEE